MTQYRDPAAFLTVQRARLAQFIACQIYGVPVDEIRKPTRGRPLVSRTRQVAVHLARSVFAMSHRELAAEFGRDRSTVKHACEQIERMREDSVEFDSTMRWMEALLRRAAGLPEAA